MTLFGWIILAVIVLAILIVLAAWFNERGTREISLVRTGVGGRRIVMDGGVLAIPYFHEVSRVNMKTLRLEVQRRGDASLITKDRMRVDVGAEFYVAVTPDEQGIARAVQTLGSRTFHADQLRELIEGKLIDALRSVAARMTMDELHENRGAFVKDVRDSLDQTLARNGLDLESVSLTALDQTPFKSLDENNAFNAVGMRKLAEVIAKSKKDRAEIDADAEVAVRRAAVEATKRKLQIELEEQKAQIEQVQSVETLKAAQIAEVARKKAASEQEAAQARIAMEQQIRAADIARERAVREAEIDRDRQLEEAEIKRDKVRAEQIKSEQAIETARRMAEAERAKAIALLSAQQDSETSSLRIRAESDAAAARAEARKRELLAEADGQKALAAAENSYSEGAASMKIDLARIKAMPDILAQMVKPAEKIESIRINHISGLGSSHSGGDGHKPPVNQALDSIMDMALQMPALKSIGEEIGRTLQDAVPKDSDRGRKGSSGGRKTN
ncbi:MAG: flotillin family protein [Rhizobiaceae bacterium]|nr:flotillin family protein [Rhizobiaceae bacterium]